MIKIELQRQAFSKNKAAHFRNDASPTKDIHKPAIATLSGQPSCFKLTRSLGSRQIYHLHESLAHPLRIGGMDNVCTFAVIRRQ